MDLIDLRYSLALQRIREIPGENAVSPAFVRYFQEGAGWFLLIDDEMRFLSSGEERNATAETLRRRNRKLYEEILPENYGTSFACPDYSVKAFGEEMGPVMAALRYEMRSAVPFAYRLERERVLIRMELFLEVHTAFTIAFLENRQSPETEQLTSIIRQYLADYAEDEMKWEISNRLTVRDDRVSAPRKRRSRKHRSGRMERRRAHQTALPDRGICDRERDRMRVARRFSSRGESRSDRGDHYSRIQEGVFEQRQEPRRQEERGGPVPSGL